MMGSSHSSEADLRAEAYPHLEEDEITPANADHEIDEITPANQLREVVVADGVANGIAALPGDPLSSDVAVEDYGSTGGPSNKPAKSKKEKNPQKKVADLLKTDMAAERTFFKWLWTGLHTGAIGSFIFVTFDSDKSDPMRLFVVAFAWIIAFMLVLYGLFAYYRRREALRTGRIECIPNVTREHSPVIVVVALGLVVGAGLLYAAFTNSSPHKGKTANAFGNL